MMTGRHGTMRFERHGSGTGSDVLDRGGRRIERGGLTRGVISGEH
ncbi:hypothetical protein OO015_12895 [Thermomicrobium sp. 4228-Ro]|nr:hypothetical protein [Thermomicrobium sp. 4228-Ro]MCX2728388.1 hypothetical protein [Thermomicrobium sp. 4228-Ro]